MQLSDALAIARSGRALAFLGSGFSLGATSISNDSIPSASDLAKRLMRAAGESEDADFDLAADLFVKVNSGNPVALNTFLQNQFTTKTLTPVQEAFARYPWQRIYTTNYDDIVEVATRRYGCEFIPVSWRHPPSHYNVAEKWTVHLHGFVGDIAKAGAKEAFLLGRQSYIDLKLLRTQWPTQLQADLAKATAVFVLGFSFADLHIARLFRQSSALKRKTFVVVRPTANAAIRNYAAEFGTVVDCGIEAFLGELEKASALDVWGDSAVPLLSFIEHPLPETPQEPASEDVFQLMISGTFKPAVQLEASKNLAESGAI